MNTSFPIRIKDTGQVLSELDRLQIRNMVGLQLYSLEAQVLSVTFNVTAVERSGKFLSFKTKSTTELDSGAVVETISVAHSKVDSIVGIGRRLWKDVSRRVRLEQSISYRLTSATSSLISRIGSALKWTPSNRVMRQPRAS